MISTAPNSSPPNLSPDKVLRIHDHVVDLHTGGEIVPAVRGVSLELPRSGAIGVVGESGSGKSVLFRSVLGLLDPRIVHRRTGRVELLGVDVSQPQEVRRACGTKISMVLQDPMTSLNPVVRVGRQLGEVLRIRLGMSKEDSRRRSIELLDAVGISDPARRLRQYPHEFSGGMRQRIAIAIALAGDPAVLIADEPTTALDVTIQAQILDLLSSVRQQRGTAYILISHDLAIVAGRTDVVIVMYAGNVVEQAQTEQLFRSPRMPYTAALLNAIPVLGTPQHSRLRGIAAAQFISRTGTGCAFAPRCPYAQARCLGERPPLSLVGADHHVACWYPLGTDANRSAIAANLTTGFTAAGLAISPDDFAGFRS